MRVLLFGATGMIGKGVLLECLDDPAVTAVTAIARSPLDITHPKLATLQHTDYFDYSAIRDRLAGFDACFFCLGVTAAGKSEAGYERLTYTLTLAAARTLAELNPGMKFCYVSGQNTDATGAGRVMWARVKGRTENALLELDLDAYMFRPGFVLPLRGVRSKTPLYQFVYSGLRPFLPMIRRLIPRHSTTSVNIGRAMLHVARMGAAKRRLENVDIDVLAASENTENPSGSHGEHGDIENTEGRRLASVFGPGARAVLARAIEESEALRHDYLGTEHILLAVLQDESGSASAVIEALGIDRARVREAVLEDVERGSLTEPMGERPYTPEAVNVIQAAAATAEAWNGVAVGSIHLLTALASTRDDRAMRAFQLSGVSPEDVVREALSRVQGTEST